jgi:GNAT superfamily N-acetyltransferase
MLAHVRPARADEATAIARVHDRCWRATYTGMLPDSVIAGSALVDREALWSRLLSLPDAWRCAYVAATPDGQIIGCAWGGPEESGDPDYRAELLGIYLLDTHQGRGLGRRLIEAVAANLHRQRHPALLLWALSENHRARRFYETLGGQLLREREITMRGVPVREVAFGWPDISRLAAPFAGRDDSA